MMGTATAMKPCPPWCAREADHDADEVAMGDDGRVHFTVNVGDQHASWDDRPGDSSRAWWFEPFACDIWESTASGLASELRDYANEILSLADMLDEIEAAS